jgi:signal transduction histidine kinase
LGLGDHTLMQPSTRRRLLWLTLAIVGSLIVLAFLRLPVYLRSPNRGLPYRDSFAGGKADEWKALGGTWEVVDGTMRNDSDERGAKLVTGSPYWHNYSIEADVMLLGQSGDAGLTVRSSNEEEGVDSYMGYYAGLRNLDNSLVIGRADHGWMEDNRKLDPIQGGIRPFKWYHLKLLAYECQVVVTAYEPPHGSITSTAISDRDCVRSGRVGLRSYSSGGVWKNVVVRAATQQDLLTMLGTIPSRETSAVQPSPAESPDILGFPNPDGNGEKQNFRLSANAQPIGSLRLSPFSNTSTATVRGVVILTSPALFVQDSTGGVSVTHPNAPPLTVGDEVEVSGEVRPGDFSSTLDRATVRVLWARTPMPPVAVTASQAATGAFDANFIELDGYLRSKNYGPDNTLIFNFDDGPQAFRAMMNRGRGNFLFNKLKPNSLLRLRGICVVDSAYTRNLTPFVLLLPSTDDVEILAGPPWWSAGHLVALAISLLVLALLVIFFYGLAERWRLRAVLEERERLAHEMHDTIAQSFAGIGFQIEAIRNGIPLNLSASHQQLDLASDLVRHSHEEARRSISTLRPESLGDLLPALDLCARRMVEGGTVKVVSSCSGNQRPMPVRITDTLYRIGQEAIANAVRHGHPDRLTIALDFEKHVVHLLVADDGVGFTQTRDLRGFGMHGMRKRAASISANLHILSSPGQGTRVRITASLPPRITLLSWPKFAWKYFVEHRSNAQSARQPYPNSYRG